MAISDNAFARDRQSDGLTSTGKGVPLILTESLSSDFPALLANLVPGPTVHLHRTVTKLTGEDDNLRNDKLGNASRVRKGRVEHSDALLRSKLKIHLVRTNAEAPNDQQVLRFPKDLLSELCLGADTNNVYIPVSRHETV